MLEQDSEHETTEIGAPKKEGFFSRITSNSGKAIWKLFDFLDEGLIMLDEVITIGHTVIRASIGFVTGILHYQEFKNSREKLKSPHVNENDALKLGHRSIIFVSAISIFAAMLLLLKEISVAAFGWSENLIISPHFLMSFVYLGLVTVFFFTYLMAKYESYHAVSLKAKQEAKEEAKRTRAETFSEAWVAVGISLEALHTGAAFLPPVLILIGVLLGFHSELYYSGHLRSIKTRLLMTGILVSLAFLFLMLSSPYLSMVSACVALVDITSVIYSVLYRMVYGDPSTDKEHSLHREIGTDAEKDSLIPQGASTADMVKMLDEPAELKRTDHPAVTSGSASLISKAPKSAPSLLTSFCNSVASLFAPPRPIHPESITTDNPHGHGL